MLRKAINYILVTLIALQSVAAFANIHLYPPSDVGHASTEEHHAHDTNTASIDDVEIDVSHDDCNQCCHCHCSAGPFLSKYQNDSSFSTHRTGCPDYLFSTISFQDSPDNPPPIL